MYKILRAHFPFTENSKKTKLRPVLQLTKANGRYHTLVVAYITSQISEVLDTDVVIEEFDCSGLSRKSVVRLHKMSNFALSKMDLELGQLPTKYESEVKRKLKKMLGL